jgi:hypothetical protein
MVKQTERVALFEKIIFAGSEEEALESIARFPMSVEQAGLLVRLLKALSDMKRDHGVKNTASMIETLKKAAAEQDESALQLLAFLYGADWREH